MTTGSSEEYAYLFKITFIGKESVGKTCLIKRFTHGSFSAGQNATIGVDFFIKTIKIDGETVKLQLWDTAGQERFRCITQTYYRSANAIILVYDIANQASFECLPSWLEDVRTFASPEALVCLVGNKIDLETPSEEHPDGRQVLASAGAAFASANGMFFLETSAKDATNVSELIEQVTRRLVALEASRISSAGGGSHDSPGRRQIGGGKLQFNGSPINGTTASSASSFTSARVQQTSSNFMETIRLGAKNARSTVASIAEGGTNGGSSSCCNR